MRNTMKSKRAGKHKEGEIFDKNEMVARCPFKKREKASMIYIFCLFEYSHI